MLIKVVFLYLHRYLCVSTTYTHYASTKTQHILTHTSNKNIIRTKRDHRPSRRAEFGRYLCSIDWSSIKSDQNSCEEMWNFFMM